MDRTAVPGLTIDDARSRDLDDAIWVETGPYGWKVFVTIADAARAVPVGSPDDEQARALVTTRYYATGSSPMLPRHLSEQTLSLHPGSTKKTVTVELDLAPDLSTRSVRMYGSRFVSRARLTYREIPSIIDDAEHPSHAQVKALANLALALLEKRRSAGALVLYDLNNGWVTTEEGYLKHIDHDETTIGYVIVQELMIAANVAVAAYVIEHDIPVPFRNHTARAATPDRAVLMEQIAEAATMPTDVTTLRQRTHMLLDKASYGPQLLGHYGLNVPAYLHFTSPIRRYVDLIVHRQIGAHLRGRPLPYTREDIEQLSTHINEVIEAERKATGDYLKEKAEGRARSTLTNVRKLDALDGRSFERAVKVAARSGAECPDELQGVYRTRLADGRVPLAAMLATLVESSATPGWVEMRKATLGALRNKPHDAVGVLMIASQAAGWPAIEYDTKSEGPPHAPSFTACARLGNGTTSSIQIASTVKLAQQRAALELVALLAGLEPPKHEDPRPVGKVARTPAVPDANRDPISALQEWSQAMGLAMPEYTFDMSGPPHAPVVTCTCSTHGVTAAGRGSKKQDAKRSAASAVIAQLRGQSQSVAV